jgi:hypothetical protein
MKVELAQELLNELGSSVEKLETQHAALLQFLKDKGVVAEAEFAPYLEQASKASSVRWRAARVRLEYLISAEQQAEEKAAEKERRPTGGEQAWDKAHEEGAKAKNGDSSSTSPQGEKAGADAPGQGAGMQAKNEQSSIEAQSNTEKSKG